MKKVVCISVIISVLLTVLAPCVLFASDTGKPVVYTVLESDAGWKMGIQPEYGVPKAMGEIKETVDPADFKKSTFTVSVGAKKGTAPDSFVMVDMTTAFNLATEYRSGKVTAAVTVETDIISVSLTADEVEKVKKMIGNKTVFFRAKKNSKIQNRAVLNKVPDVCYEIEYGFVDENENDILYTEIIPETDEFSEFYEEDETQEVERELVYHNVKVGITIPHIYEKSRNIKLYEVSGNKVSEKKFDYDGKKIKYSTQTGTSVVVAEEMYLEIVGRTLDLQGTISMIFYAGIEGTDPLNTKMLFWTSPQDNYTVENAELIVSSSGKDSNGYKFEYKNISSKEMSKEVYARLVTTTDEGETVYGKLPDEPYSVVAYAKNMMKKNKSLEPLLVKMLNYGAAAQEYFGSEYSPANAHLTANQRATDFTKAYSSEDAVIPEDVGKKSTAEIYGSTLSLEGDISINYYTLCPDEYDKIGMLFWNEEAYNRTDRHIIGTESRRTTEYQINGDYKIFTYGNIVSREMYSSVYARLYTVKDGVYSYSDIKKYSVRDYAARQLAKNDDEKLSKLLRCLMLYGEEARSFFNKK